VSNLRHFLDIDKFDLSTLRGILNQATEFKSGNLKSGNFFKDKILVLMFEKPSTRTRVSFEVGMRQLGGNTVVMSEIDSQLGRGETIADTARVLSRYASILMLRTDSHQKLLELANYAAIPVVNGLTNDSHPCQILADILTFEEHRGSIEGKTVAWVGDGNNVATSWLHASTKLGFEFRIATPPGLRLNQEMISWAKEQGGQAIEFTDPKDAVEGADCVITDTWVSMGHNVELTERRKILKPYQVNTSLMAGAKNNALFMHCLPAHRGEEVTGEVIDGPRSVVWDEAENRLHIQKSILAWCLHF
jgi:ornithine carbamoyltransferase